MTFAEELAEKERSQYIDLWPKKKDPKPIREESIQPSMPAFSSPQEERRQGSKLSIKDLKDRNIALFSNPNSRLINGRLSGSSYDLRASSDSGDDIWKPLETQPEDLEFYSYRTPQGTQRYKIWSKREQKFISSSDF